MAVGILLVEPRRQPDLATYPGDDAQMVQPLRDIGLLPSSFRHGDLPFDRVFDLLTCLSGVSLLVFSKKRQASVRKVGCTVLRIEQWDSWRKRYFGRMPAPQMRNALVCASINSKRAPFGDQ